jgi:DNA-binding GntR family transcriptional regulator
MDTESGEPRVRGNAGLERIIVLQLLGEEAGRKWTLEALTEELGASHSEVEAALRALQGDGVVCFEDGQAWPSRAARRIDELELIGI